MTKVEIGDATLYLGDFRKVLPPIADESVAVITDPPYGISHASGYVAETTTAEWMETTIQGDDSLALRDASLISETWACFGSDKLQAPANTKATLIWDKGPASGMGDLRFPWKRSYELIFVSGGGWQGSRDEGVIKGHWIVTRASMGRVHPNEKPVSLMAYLVSRCAAATIVDPFMGSGSTGVACADLGRRFIGCEIEPKYFELACERIRSTYAQQRLFA
jgi:DNA modification methylase